MIKAEVGVMWPQTKGSKDHWNEARIDSEIKQEYLSSERVNEWRAFTLMNLTLGNNNWKMG